MQAQTTATRRCQAFIFVLVLLCQGAAWAAGSTSTVTQANQTRMNDEAEQWATQGHYQEAATRFEALAAQASSADRDHFIVKAARYALLGGDGAKAQSLLLAAGKNLKPSDHALRLIINASLLLAADKPDQAIATLDQIPLPLPADVAADALSVRSQAYFAAGRTVLGVNTMVERERVLKLDSEIAQNRQLLWNQLKPLANTDRDLTPPAGANRITAGWLDLAKVYGNGQRDPFAFNRNLTNWRERYPNHPGTGMLINTNATPAAVNTITGAERLALLLPLSGRQQAAGVAVRDGFMAALLQRQNTGRPTVQVFDTNELGAKKAYDNAVQMGATMVVGPLLKEDVDAIATSQQIGVMTLSLNAMTAAQAAPALMFQFALDPEEEARQVAQRAHDEGHSRVILLTPNNEWGQRIQRAFLAELQALGDTLVDQRSYDSGARDYVGMAKQLFASRKPPAKALDEALGKRPLPEARDDFDYIFLAAQTAQAKQLRPALRFVLPDTSIPIYATSDAYEPETSNSDLDGLRFVDMPWVINRLGDTAKLHDDMDRVWSNGLRNRSRLYAFGVDAFNLVAWLKTPQPQLATPLRGATGWLAVDQAGRVRRQADWAQIVNGKPQALPELALP